MTHGFNKGIYRGWSPYFDFSSYNSIVQSEQLPVPNKKTYTVEDSGVDLTEELQILDQSEGLPLEVIITTLNKAKDFDTIQRLEHPRFNDLVEVINKHNTFSYSTGSLKNYVVRNIIETSNHAKNQIASYSPITFGEYEQIKKEKENNFSLSLLDGIGMEQQQETNAVGKDVIGVAANGIKDYFALVTYFSNYYNEGFAKTDKEYFERAFDIGTGTSRVNRIAGMDLETKAIEVLNQYVGNELGVSLNPYSDPALTLSALLSAATDNAKELILKTINAGKDFAAMHLYMIILGFSEGDVANFMTSSDILAMMKSFKSNIFTGDRRANVDVVVSKISTEDSAELQQFKEIYNLSKELTSLAKILKINQGLKANSFVLSSYFRNMENDFVTREVQFITDNFKVVKENLGLNDQVKPNEYLKQMVLLDKPYLTGFDSYVDGVIATANELGISEGGFSFESYFSNDNYREAAKEYYNLIKGTFNILDVVDKLGHFKGMVDATKISYDTVKSMSKKFNFVTDVVPEVLKKSTLDTVNFKVHGTDKPTINENQTRNAETTFDDLVISKWFKTFIGQNENFTFNLSDLPELTNTTVTYYDDRGGLNNLGTDKKTIDFTEDMMLVNFKHVMENNLLPYLKKANPDNQFLSGLILRKATGIDRSWISTRVRMNRLIDPKNLDLLHQYQQGFDKLVEDEVEVKIGEKSFNVADLFFMYNLVVNKDRFGSDRLTKLFGNYVTNPNNISRSFYEFYSRIDSGQEELFDDNMPLDDKMQKIIEYGILNTRGELEVTKGHNNEEGVYVEGEKLRLPNPNFTLVTTLQKLAPQYKNDSLYRRLLEHINNKNLLIQFNCG